MNRLAYIFLLASVALSAADITVSVADVEPLPFKLEGVATSPEDLFRRSCPEELDEENGYNPELLLSSYDGTQFPNGSLYPSSDGFIRGAIDAWAHHQALVLRPDEVWFEILAQLNFYMSSHAEDIRHLFVDHEGKREMHVEATSWRNVVASFASEIQKRVKTDWLLGWVTPGFSTSTDNDQLTATVLMMGLMQYYFEFSGSIVCGIPTVTLLGTRDDWARLLGKLDRLGEWGEQPATYANNLRPILKRFVQTWDEPASAEVKSFWRQIVRASRHFSCGAGPSEYTISGWITGFMHWSKSGEPRIPPDEEVWEGPDSVKLDGVVYAPEPLEDIRVGYAKAPLVMVDYPGPGENTTAYLLAGNVGVQRTKGEGGRVATQPSSAWFMYAPVDTNRTTNFFGSFTELVGHTEDELVRHINELHCIVCDRSFGTARSLQQHVRDSPSHVPYWEAYGLTDLPQARRRQRQLDRRHDANNSFNRPPSPDMPGQYQQPQEPEYATSLYEFTVGEPPTRRRRLASTGIEQQLLDAAAAEAALVYAQQPQTPEPSPPTASSRPASHGRPDFDFDFDFDFRAGLELALPRFIPSPDGTQATLLSVSCSRQASRMASET